MSGLRVGIGLLCLSQAFHTAVRSLIGATFSKTHSMSVDARHIERCLWKTASGDGSSIDQARVVITQ